MLKILAQKLSPISWQTSGKILRSYSLEKIKSIADYLKEKNKTSPKIGIICGSGLSSLTDSICDQKLIEFGDIPKFPVTTVEGHVGRMVFGDLEEMPVMAMQGRFHFYEGYPLSTCSMPVRVMKLMGVEYLMATNAAGGINQKYKVGDIMIIRDHINMIGLSGKSALRGANEPEFGPRFPPMTNAYSPELIAIAQKASKEMGIDKEVHLGTYVCVGGPSYESTAEIKMLQTVGGDAVGMSTAHEVVTARHCDLKVFAFSLITNKCEVEYNTGKKDANHAEVVMVGKERQNVCRDLLCRVIREIKNSKNNC